MDLKCKIKPEKEDGLTSYKTKQNNFTGLSLSLPYKFIIKTGGSVILICFTRCSHR